RAIGRYLRAHKAAVSVFYTSNVESYLFENGSWNAFMANVQSLPLGRNSAFIRAHFAGGSNDTARAGSQSTTQLASTAGAIEGYDRGRIIGYSDLIGQSDARRTR